MSAKSPEVVDGMLDESLLGVLLILLVVLLSTGYVYIRQLQAGANNNNNNANNNRQRGAAAQIVGRAAPGAGAAPVNVVATAGLNDRQLKLHYALPVRHGARTMTVSGDALLDRSTPGTLAWASEGGAALLKDLTRIADVYVLCSLPSGADEEARKLEMQQVRAFLAENEELKGAVKPHKVLFCSTSIGEIAFVRQLEPQVHIEVDAGVVRELEKHVPRIIHVTTGATVTPSVPNVIHVADNIETYFALLGAK